MPWNGDWGDGLPEGGGWEDGDWGDGVPLGPSPGEPTPPVPTPASWKVEILIEGEVVWSATTSIPKQEVAFDVSRFTGRKDLKFRLTRTA